MFSFFSKTDSKYTYIINQHTFVEYLTRSVNFAKENHLESVTDFKIYYHDKTYSVSIWDFTESELSDEQEKGFSITLDKVEYQTVDNFINNGALGNIRIKDCPYLKIKLTDSDDTFLNEYKKSHPELTDDFYNQF